MGCVSTPAAGSRQRQAPTLSDFESIRRSCPRRRASRGYALFLDSRLRGNDETGHVQAKSLNRGGNQGKPRREGCPILIAGGCGTLPAPDGRVSGFVFARNRSFRMKKEGSTPLILHFSKTGEKKMREKMTGVSQAPLRKKLLSEIRRGSSLRRPRPRPDSRRSSRFSPVGCLVADSCDTKLGPRSLEPAE